MEKTLLYLYKLGTDDKGCLVLGKILGSTLTDELILPEYPPKSITMYHLPALGIFTLYGEQVT